MFLSLAMATSLAAASAQDLTLYGGQALAGAQFSISNWGGGYIKEDTQNVFVGGHALLITTSSMYNGGMITFDPPVKVAEFVPNPENALSLTLFVVGRSGTADNRPANLSALRLLIRTSDGKLSEAFLPFEYFFDRWKKVGIPLNRIAGFSKTNMEISSVSIGANAPAAIYVGELRVVTDKTPIQGQLDKLEIQAARDQEITFAAIAEAGSTIVEYVWDWDEKDGLQEDSIGQTVYHRFRAAGDYVVTVTARDRFGVKKPWTGKIKVTVWK